MTAEPRMEDLLASIRKAINEDIGEEPATPQRPQNGTPHSPAPRAPAIEGREKSAKVSGEAKGTSSEIQQLREKITRSRNGEPLTPRDPAQRAASLAAALRSETPRRSWRDLDKLPPTSAASSADASASPPPRLRGTLVESETPRAPRRVEASQGRPIPRFAPSDRAAAWPPEEAATRADQDSILSGGSAQAVQSAFSRLADTVMTRATGEKSIEEMTRELLRVMLKQWLDDNLPQMVERLVREEIERVARSGR